MKNQILKSVIRIEALLADVRNDRRGVTIIEYGLLAALIGVALAASLTGLKTTIASTFTSIGSAL